MLYFAVDKSDKKALTTLTDSIKSSTNHYVSNGTIIDSCITNYILDNNLFKPRLDEFQKDAIKLILDVKTNTTITAEDLQILSFTGPEDEFKQFCQKKEVNITDEKFKKLDLSHYKYAEKAPVAEIAFNSTQYNLVDILLNKTYSDLLSANAIKEIYENIYAINNDGKETLTYIATLMNKGHPLKIIFENGTLSYYSHMQDIIKIDTNFAREVDFNIESVVAHEMKHFIYDQVFKFDSRPIDPSPIKEINEKADNIFGEGSIDFEQDNAQMEFIIESFDFLRNHVFNNDSGIITFFANFQQYQAAATAPLEYAAKLLGINSINSNYTMPWAQHLKFNSKIDLFHLKSQSMILEESLSNIDTISDATYHSLFNMYQEHEVPKFHNKTEILKWAKEELYPEFIKELNLSRPEIHFLERMADLVNRAGFFPQNGCNIRGDNENIEVESIVRSLELKLSIGNETKIMDTFVALDQFHAQHATPIICKFLNENSQIASLPFSDKYLPGEIDICNISTCE